jgi:FKBP-type peptidyl-prolyl cis-trans isomerase FkpA
MLRLITAVLLVLLATPAFAAIVPKSDEQKTLYAIGALQGRDLSEFSLSSSEFEMVQQGFADSASGRKPIINIDAYIGNIKALAKTRQAAAETKYAAAEKEFYNKVAAEKGTVKTESGLLYQSLREGSGASPTALNRVKVHYRTTLVNKKEINNTYKLKTPAVLRMNYVDRCFSEGVQLMKVGGKARLICPPELLFKSKVRDSGVPPNSFEVYDVELLDVLK